MAGIQGPGVEGIGVQDPPVTPFPPVGPGIVGGSDSVDPGFTTMSGELIPGTGPDFVGYFSGDFGPAVGSMSGSTSPGAVIVACLTSSGSLILRVVRLPMPDSDIAQDSYESLTIETLGTFATADADNFFVLDQTLYFEAFWIWDGVGPLVDGVGYDYELVAPGPPPAGNFLVTGDGDDIVTSDGDEILVYNPI